MNGFLRFSLFILIVLTTVVLTSTVVLGFSYKDFGTSDYSSSSGAEQVLSVKENIVNMIANVGKIVALALVVVLSIKYMTATPSKKAELKDRSWMLVVGVVLLFAMPSLMNMVSEFGVMMRGTGRVWYNTSSSEGEKIQLQSVSGGMFDWMSNLNSGNSGNSLYPSLTGGNTTYGNQGGNSNSTAPGNTGNLINPTTPGSTGDIPNPSKPPVTTEYGPASGATETTDLKVGDTLYFLESGSDGTYHPSRGGTRSYQLQSGERLVSPNDFGANIYVIADANTASTKKVRYLGLYARYNGGGEGWQPNWFIGHTAGYTFLQEITLTDLTGVI